MTRMRGYTPLVNTPVLAFADRLMKAKPWLRMCQPNTDGVDKKRNHAKLLHPSIIRRKPSLERDRDSALGTTQTVRIFTLLSNENCMTLTSSHLLIFQ